MLRDLVASDLDSCLRLTEAAGWNQTPEDWQRVLALCPGLAIGIEQEGNIVASAMSACYGESVAWVGMVLTLPEWRGRGFADRLMREILDRLRSRGIGWAKLDATHLGEPIYARLGFVPECAIERWLGQGLGGAETTECAVDLDLDRAVFGADRSALLRAFPPTGCARTGLGYALLRPGLNATFLGPAVIRGNETSARELLQSALSQVPRGREVMWDVFPQNEGAVRIAQEAGFAPVRKLVRMGLKLQPGAEVQDTGYDHYFGAAGFEWG